jgi:hypothetical protein
MIHYHMHQQHMALQRTEGHFFLTTINLLSLKSWVCILGLTVVCFAFLGVVFCLDFDPFFFSSLVLLPSVFPLFLYFIYVFI